MKQKREKVAVPLDPTNKGKAEVKLLADCEAFQLPDGPRQGPYPTGLITYVTHHGLEVPGHIIFDGKKYRTSRVETYDSITDAAIALVRGD